MSRNAQILEKCFTHYNKGKLFEKWFINNGKAYYFLFKKNLKVTNIQFAELVSLIRINAVDTIQNDKSINTKIGNKLQFLSVQQFNSGIREIIKTFSTTGNKKRDTKRVYLEISEIYSDLLSHTIVVDNLYGSCAIFIPPGIDIDIEKICACSGYIHSCGKRIFIRNIDKYETESFHKALDQYLKSVEKKIFFCIYAHEDFTDYDRDVSEELKNGLDEVKIYEEKFFMGKVSLVSLLSDIKKRFPGRFIIPPRGNFKIEHKKIMNKRGNNIDRSRTLWLIKEHSANQQTLERGDRSYYICYEQLFINKNQFYLFDENKPAWKSSTTMPHTLTAAMINIALSECQKMYAKEIDNIIIGDPCVGTGTTWFECLKYNFIISHCSDLDLLSGVLIKDNLEFFSMPLIELEKFDKHLTAKITLFKKGLLNNNSKQQNKRLNTSFKAYHSEVLAPLLKIIPKNNTGEFDFRKKAVQKIRILKFNERFVLYILMRVILKYENSFQRTGIIDISLPFIKEAEKILKQIKHLIEIKKRDQQNGKNNNSQEANISFHQSNYSLGTTIDESFLCSKHRELNFGKEIFRTGKKGDITLIKKNFFDIIVIDPPYGFNTKIEGGIRKLAQCYQNIIRHTILALKSDGQIIMALPDKSLSGKISPLFTHKEIVLQEFLRIAEEEGKEIVLPSKILPTRETFSPPFYWEAEKALRRSIIHLRIISKSIK